MAAPIVGNYAVALAEEIKQLCVPVICAQWPTVMEDERLCVFRTPILVENFDAVLGSDYWHALTLTLTDGRRCTTFLDGNFGVSCFTIRFRLTQANVRYGS